MFLQSLQLLNFRSYEHASFTFSPDLTLIIGPNTSGKTNMLEAMTLLSRGKSFKAEKEGELIRFGSETTYIKGRVDETTLEVRLQNGQRIGREAPLKKYLLNDVPKRRVDFAGTLTTVLFSPADLEILIGSPGLRRRFLNEVLEQTDREYRIAITTYEKALRQRNALLDMAKETGRRNDEQFRYWDELLITNGTLITYKRQVLIDFINESQKDVFSFTMYYDKSVISKERLLQYKDAEVGSGVTLVGPHRDDFALIMEGSHDVKLFGSRGQQRLAILQLKLLQLASITTQTGAPPVLLLDDVFSELDAGHIKLVLEYIGSGQTIMTTTHKEFVGNTLRKNAHLIELGD